MLSEDLAGLSKQQLRQLKAKIDFELTTDSDPVSREGMIVWQALRASSRGSPYNTVEKLIDRVSRRQYDLMTDYVHDFITRGCGQPITLPQRYAVATMILRCLAEYLRDRDEPDTATNLCDKIEWLEYAVDKQFPYYANAKKLHMLAPIEQPKEAA